MKYWLLFVIPSLLMAAAFSQIPVNHPQPRGYGDHCYVLPGKVAIEWKFVDAYRVWLSINSLAGSEWIQEGYHPGFTYLRSQFKPIVKQLPEGQYEITFSAEISK